MGKYEMVVIVDAASSQEKKDAVLKEVGQLIEKHKGKVINTQVWHDKVKMSFLMKKKAEGTYYLVNFEGDKSSLPDLRRALRLHEGVLRALIIASDDKA